MSTFKAARKTWIAGLLTATAASLCCITPVLALISGTSGIASTFSWMEPFRPYLIGLTVAVLVFVWYQKLKPVKTNVECNCNNGKTGFLQSKMFLAIVTVLAVLLLTFPSYSKIFFPKPETKQVIVVDKRNIQTVFFKIKGMTCEGCTQHVNNEISKVNGVIGFQTSYENGSSSVKFDISKTSVDSIALAIRSTGYKIVSQSLINK